MPTWYNNYIPNWAHRWIPTPKPTLSPYRVCPTNDGCLDEAVIGILNVDLCLEENNDKHHTDHFYSAKDTLIVRRGESFRLRIRCNRIYNPTTDSISIIFTVLDATKPSPGNGTLVGLALSESVDFLGDQLQWGAAIESIDDNILGVLIKPPPTCAVTSWKVDIDSKLINAGSRSFTVAQPILILFNPWCPEDQVYLPDRDERKEYVMHDTTLIWRGSYNRLRPSVWKLGQFERNILECALKVIATVGRVPPAYRGDAVRVSRAISAAVNSVDDDGVVLGNWTEDFTGGTPPTKWVGSCEILQEFYRTQKPVKYGQCWIFSGVLTTIARALGIPSRIVTCYSAAHDTQASLTVDVFVDNNNKKLDADTTDSVWNYHVWNEVWMDRLDLGVGTHGSYGGWQVIDATPQEQSDGLYRVGPASVLAVKNGEILRPFDAGFVFSEVNADKLYWRYNGPTKPLKLLRTDTMAIGHLISTKAVLQWNRMDITNNYKFDEKTKDERNTMVNALKQAGQAFSRYYLNDNFNDVQFDMEVKEDIVIGENFTVVVKMTNKSQNKTYTAIGQLNCDTVLYTGLHSQEVKTKEFEVELQPETFEFVRMEVEFEAYFNKLTSQAAFNVSCAARVKDTDYEYYAQDDFRVRKPDIKFQFDGSIISGQPVNVIVRLANPLPIPINKGLFYIEGPGLEKALRFKILQIPVGGTAASTFAYIPPYTGRGTLLAKFSSKELDDVDGYMHYLIKPKPENILMENTDENINRLVRRTDVIQ